MPTGQVIINGALTAIGILDQGGVPSFSDSNDALSELNDQWNAWGIDEGIIFAVTAKQYNLTANTAQYAIGPTAPAPFTGPLPSRIYRASFVSGGNRNPLEVVPAATYYAHNDLAAVAVAPDELYPDFNPDPITGLASLYLWPVPTTTGSKLELETGATFSVWALGVNYAVPQGYADAIKYCLAYRLLPRYGVAVAPEVAATVTALAAKAEARIREMNKINRQMPAGSEVSPGAAQAAAAQQQKA